MDDTTALAGRDNDGISVHAGFPNPAAERTGSSLSLDRLLIHHPSSTYFFRLRGNDWEERGIFDGDLVLIDRALDPRNKDLVVWWDAGNEFYLTDLRSAGKQNIWGVVSAVIHPTRKVKDLENET